jgi:NAD/NADP transhydrogenase alpha subunit
MEARQKLNSIYLCSCVIIAGVIGAMFGSWTVFLIAVAVLLGAAVLDGAIRPTRCHQRPRRTSRRRR